MTTLWRISDKYDPAAVALADRHYNRQKPGTPQFMPPGQSFVLKSLCGRAVWATSWPLAKFTKHAWAGAWVNTIFRNEGAGLSSDLIRAAVAHTRHKWNPPPLGVVTFVDPTKVRHKRDPGRCYLKAGFRRVGMTKGGLITFQMEPAEMPDAEPVFDPQLVMAL